MPRPDGRRSSQLRPVIITRGFLPHAEGSALIEIGDTKVICAASLDDRVPRFLQGSGQGWVSAEYGMLPRSTTQRIPREASKGRVGGRTHEIQRVIGRSLRSVVDLKMMPEMTIWVDCDVIQADGGTRTAGITGAFIALVDALIKLTESGRTSGFPLQDYVAATSVGLVDGKPHLDLCYEEDARAQVDMNLVMTGAGRMVEIQGTAEGLPFSIDELSAMVTLGHTGIKRLIAEQKKIVGADIEAVAKRAAGQP